MYGKKAPLASWRFGESNFGAKQKLFFGALPGKVMARPPLDNRWPSRRGIARFDPMRRV
jgi:hypothetical protein